MAVYLLCCQLIRPQLINIFNYSIIALWYLQYIYGRILQYCIFSLLCCQLIRPQLINWSVFYSNILMINSLACKKLLHYSSIVFYVYIQLNIFLFLMRVTIVLSWEKKVNLDKLKLKRRNTRIYWSC